MGGRAACSGLMQGGLWQALRAFTREGDAVALMRPLYTPLQELVGGAGRRLVALDGMDSSGSEPRQLSLDLDALRATLSGPAVKLLIWCSPHNPSGRVWTRTELRGVAALCHELGVFIISDEIWAGVRLVCL